MKEEKFTEDNDFNELKSLLKDLPKVNTPDNFEFNLMTKIQNQNFEVKSEKKKKWLSWSLTPAIAFATTVFVVVLFVFNSEEVGSNPWETPPKLMDQSQEIASAQVTNVEKDKRINKSSGRQVAKNITQKELVAENNKTKAYPFEKNSSINFDEYLQSEGGSSANSGARLAGGSNSSNTSPFDGFFLRQRKIAQKKDSIKKEQDSLQQKKETVE